MTAGATLIISSIRIPTHVKQVHGYPVDYCLHYETAHYGPDNALVSKRGEGCGKPAADKFCQMEGYPESEFSTAMYVKCWGSARLCCWGVCGWLVDRRD